MGVLKFLLPSTDLARRLPGLRKAYMTGLDRTPGRLSVEFRNGLMACFRETSESGRLFTPWPIAGYGTPIVGTATLAERPSPYTLALELAPVSSTTSGTRPLTGSRWACGRHRNSPK